MVLQCPSTSLQGGYPTVHNAEDDFTNWLKETHLEVWKPHDTILLIFILSSNQTSKGSHLFFKTQTLKISLFCLRNKTQFLSFHCNLYILETKRNFEIWKNKIHTKPPLYFRLRQNLYPWSYKNEIGTNPNFWRLHIFAD